MALPDPCSVAKTIADAKMMLDTLQKSTPPLVLADWTPSRSKRQGRREARERAIFEATVESLKSERTNRQEKLPRATMAALAPNKITTRAVPLEPHWKCFYRSSDLHIF